MPPSSPLAVTNKPNPHQRLISASSSARGCAAGGGGGATSNTNKRGSNWNELYATVRGKANMLGKKGEKWESGIKRGNANQVW